MTDAELELRILQRYVEHYDSVGDDAPKCSRELDMRDVISSVVGRPIADNVAKRWHTKLAPQSPPYAVGVLRPCSDSTINTRSHSFHARAYYEPGKAPAWERVQQLQNQVPVTGEREREREQKFHILNSLGQAVKDFTEYSTGTSKKTTIGILFLDIDDFKRLNSAFTEALVDRNILIPFQEMLRGACSHRGQAYRHGGEEFLVLLPNHTQDEVERFADRLCSQVREMTFEVAGKSLRITASIGVAFWPTHGRTLDEVIAAANMAEHLAKDRGKNQVVVHTEARGSH